MRRLELVPQPIALALKAIPLPVQAIAPAEVESVFRGVPRPDLLGRVVEPVHDESRWVALGTTGAARQVTLIFTRRGEALRPISCRAMRRNERRASCGM